jgi:hemoglobin
VNPNDLPNPDRPIYTPPGGPPRTDRIPRAVYEQMGEDGVFELARDFYRRLGESRIATMFPQGEAALRSAADKTGAMFVFLFGGPPLYQKRHGPPMMRARHLPFRIDADARLAWLECLAAALDASTERGVFPSQHRAAMDAFFHGFSTWMVNAE